MLNVFDRSILILNEKLSKEYILFILVVISSILGIFLVFKKYDYYLFYNTNSIINDNTITINIYDKYLNDITSSSKVLIDEKEYDFEIINLSSPNLDLNNNIYYELSASLKNIHTLNNKVVQVKFKYRKFNIFKEFIRILKEG